MHMLAWLFGNKQNHFHHNYFLKAKDKVIQRNQYYGIWAQNKWLIESFDRFTIFSQMSGCLYLMCVGNNETEEENEWKFSVRSSRTSHYLSLSLIHLWN